VFDLKIIKKQKEIKLMLNFGNDREDIMESKKIEKKLKESEEKYRTLVESSLQGICILQDVKIVFANPALAKILGYSVEELYTLKTEEVMNLIYIDDRDFVFNRHQERLKGKKVSSYYDFRIVRKDTQVRWVEMYATLIEYEGKPAVQEVFLDISHKRNAEQKLKESKEKYQFLFETSPFSIYLFNRNGEIIDCNLNAQRKLGYPKFELIGKKITQLSWFLSDDKLTIMENLKLLSNSVIPKPFDMQIRTKAGSLIWGHFEFSFVKSGMKELIQVIIQDITKNKESERKLREAKEKFSNLVKNISDIIFRMDLNGIIKYNSPQSSDILGYTQEELLGANLLKNVHPDDLLQLANAIRETIIGKNETSVEFRYKHKMGYYIHLSAKGRLINTDGKEEITGIIRDITKKKKMEIKLRESEKKYRGILENIEEGYYETDLQGNIIFFNNSFVDMIGYSREELLGQNYKKFMDDQTALQTFKGFNYVYETEKSLNDLQFEITRKNGEKRVNQSSVYLIYDSKGNIIGYRGFIRDITEKKRAEELEQKFKEQLENEVQIRTKELIVALEQQKLYLDQIMHSSQVKNEFLATMSHELRTPLNAIIGFTDLLLEGAYGPLNKDQLEFIKDIKSSAEHQFEMVKHILDISKIESGKISLRLQEFSVKNIMEQIISTLKPDYSKKDLKFEINGLKNNKYIVADPIKLKEILLNLLDNAIKYTRKGKITLVFKEDKENWIFKVKDTGIGIEKKDYNIIFDDFKRVDSDYVSSLPGTGLGLSLTKRLVALHGGTISFTSKIDVGSTFLFTIPKSLRIPAIKKAEEFLKNF